MSFSVPIAFVFFVVCLWFFRTVKEFGKKPSREKPIGRQTLGNDLMLIHSEIVHPLGCFHTEQKPLEEHFQGHLTA